MPSLDYDLKTGCQELFTNSRWDLLTMLILHANVRNRCWPSTERLIFCLGKSRQAIVDAKEWLLEHGAITLVPYDKRVEAEQKLPRRQHVYQLTGIVTIGTRTASYLHIDRSEVLKTETSENGSSKNQNLSITSKNASVSNKDSSAKRGKSANTSKQNAKTAPGSAAPPKTREELDPIFVWCAEKQGLVAVTAYADKRVSKWIWSQVGALVSAEKQRTGVDTLDEAGRRALAVRLPDFATFYEREQSGLSWPGDLTLFSKWVMRWFAKNSVATAQAGKPSADCKVCGGYGYVSCVRLPDGKVRRFDPLKDGNTPAWDRVEVRCNCTRRE